MAITPWYEAPKGEVHKKLYDYVTTLENRQIYRERENVFNLGLYEDREVMGVAPGLYVRPMSASQQARVSLNITGALCDTATNQIAQSRPMAMALTEGGDWLQQTKAKQLNHFLEGAYYSLSIFDEMQMAFGDATWGGTGVLYVDRDNDQMVCERVFPNEMIVDDSLCEFSAPYEMHRRKYLPKDKVKRLFPKFAEQIEKAKPVKIQGVRGVNYTIELIPVYTTWRLPLDKKSPGKRVVFIETATLQVSEYKKPYFPFVFMRWRRQPVGFWGKGIPAIGGRIQLDINKTVKAYSRGVALCVIPRMLLPTNSGINVEHFTNEIGSGIWHNPGAAPQWMQGTIIPPEAMGYLQFMIGQYYQLVGISELAAGMKKPAGLNSGEAQRVYADTQADRFALPSQSYENASVEIARRLIEVARDIAEEYGDYEIVHQSTKGFQRIKWSDIDLSEDEYTLKLWPINYLSKSPADLIDQVNDLIKMGLLTGKQAKRLLPFPDLEGVLGIDNAPDELTQKVIEEIVEHDNYIAPEPVMNLTDDAVKTVQFATLHYQTIGLPEPKLKMMRAWVATAQAMVNANKPTQPAPGSPGMDSGVAGLPAAKPQMAPPPAMLPS